MNAAVGLMKGSALMVIGVSAWYPDNTQPVSHFKFIVNVINLDLIEIIKYSMISFLPLNLTYQFCFLLDQ